MNKQLCFNVEIQFREGPALSSNVTADTKEAAEKEAIQLAKQCGYTFPVKKVITKPQGK